MSGGSVSSFRWQDDRRLSYREMGIFCSQHHAQLLARNRWLEARNQELAMRVVALNKELSRYQPLVSFKSGDQVGDGTSGRV